MPSEKQIKYWKSKIGKMPSNIEQLKLLPPWNKGKKLDYVPKRAFKKGSIPWNKGMKIDKNKYPNMGHNKKHSHIAIQKMKKARLGKSAYWNKGEKSPFWKGGVTPINKLIRQSFKFRVWREAVFKRDNWTCVWCGARSRKGNPVEIHPDHIKRFAEYPDLRFIVSNGRTLCKPCHLTTDTYGNKKNKNYCNNNS